MGKFFDGTRFPRWGFRTLPFILGVQDYYYGLREGDIECLATSMFFIREAEKRGVREMMESGIFSLRP